jgi:hypothetical protein
VRALEIDELDDFDRRRSLPRTQPGNALSAAVKTTGTAPLAGDSPDADGLPFQINTPATTATAISKP